MKISALFSILFLCFVLVSCGAEDEESGGSAAGAPCVTIVDCPDGYACIDSTCQQKDSKTDDSGKKSDDGNSGDSSGLPSNGETTDSGSENSDEDQGCPNACSGFGECDFETKICSCTQNHAGADCSECAEGYHLESEDYDEDGDPNIRSCVYNVTCDPDPCNGGKCTAQENTVKCECLNHTAGVLCDACEEGYLKSAVNGECKPDCSGINCEAPKKCGVDYTTNEAACNSCSDEHYSGADCKSCDADYFCSGHATACIVEGSSPKCTCETAYAGVDCKDCASGYMPKNGICVKSCTADQCFKEFKCKSVVFGDYGLEYITPGHCNISTCECDQGWKTATSVYGEGETVYCTDMAFGVPLDSRANVLCTVCDVDNPPSSYASTGCPADCYANFCNGTDTANGQGSCYTEKGTHKVYCKCASGYTMTGGSQYYDENPTGQCE